MRVTARAVAAGTAEVDALVESSEGWAAVTAAVCFALADAWDHLQRDAAATQLIRVQAFDPEMPDETFWDERPSPESIELVAWARAQFPWIDGALDAMVHRLKAELSDVCDEVDGQGGAVVGEGRIFGSTLPVLVRPNRRHFVRQTAIAANAAFVAETPRPVESSSREVGVDAGSATTITTRRISLVTRLDILDTIRKRSFCWHGRLDPLTILSTLYNLRSLPSQDPRGRYDNAFDDIYEHTVANDDWKDPNWVFEDSRFGLRDGDDATLLRFLAYALHPTVRPNAMDARAWSAVFNEHLRVDGYDLVENGQLAGRPVFVGAPCVPTTTKSPAASASPPAAWHSIDGLERAISALRKLAGGDPLRQHVLVNLTGIPKTTVSKWYRRDDVVPAALASATGEKASTAALMIAFLERKVAKPRNALRGRGN